MHSNFSFSKCIEVYTYDYTSYRAIWAIALVNYWVTHAFKVANCNGFYFNAYRLGLPPNGMLRLSMVLYDPRSMSYVHNHEDIGLFSDIDAQILYLLFTLMDFVQPNLHFQHHCCLTGCNLSHSNVLCKFISFLHYVSICKLKCLIFLLNM